ncbi:putative ABC exporter domain-containing protein [Clostridium tetanomorphum]|uniref:Uncharacterized protein n=1 Tax=Clostridium tetanomorphum TaxID=1553 RepID=A0A923E9Y8_CLOTT|nr:putative ABC exporter domain-containing protein [Clostridium tetanomorphum]MBC2397819.1 hypothetical protein [Clostridium tetanomorphum]NRZ97262.1 hypothetical protein [Clostridium tetanomorphum]
MFKDFKTLSYIKIVQVKNKIKYFLTNPITALRKLETLIFPIIFIVLSMLRRNSKKSFINSSNININLISVIIITILFIIFFYILLKASSNYKPLDFSIQDVHYLFPSPIGERSIWIFSIITGAFQFILNYFFYVILIWVILFKSLNLNIWRLFFSLIGVSLIVLFFKCLNFLIYSIKIRFNAEKLIKRICLFLAVAILVYISMTFWFASSKSFFAVINIITTKIPLLSWMKNIIIYPLSKEVFPLLDLILIFSLTVMIFTFTIILAVDYYEVVSENVELKNMNIDERSLDQIIIEDSIPTNKEESITPVKENIFHKINGEGAFLYKNSILSKRNGSLKRHVIICLVLALISFIGGHYLSIYPDKNNIYAVMFIMCLSMSLGINPVSSIKYELSKTYIYLLPGSVKKKLLYIIFHNYAFAIFILMSIILPIGLTSKEYLLTSLIYLIALIIINLSKGLSKIIVHFFIPVDDKGNGGILEGIIQYIVFFLPVIPGLIIYIKFKLMNIALLSINILGFILLIFILFISEKLFHYIELK